MSGHKQVKKTADSGVEKQARSSHVSETKHNMHTYVCTCNIQPTSRFLEFTPLQYAHAPDRRPEGLGVTVGGAHLLSGDGRDDLVRQVLQNHGAAPREETAVPCHLRRRQIE